jgi:hypothetical protein
MTAALCTLPRGAPLPTCDERLMQLHHYWLSMHPAPDAMPGRRDFDPTRIPTLLPWLWLIDVKRDPLRFKYRLVGTRHVEAAGWDPTGRWLDEAHPRFKTASAYPQFCATATHGEICYYRGPPTFVMKRDYISIERLILPLAANGRDVDMLLGIIVLHPVGPPSTHEIGRPS